jgi:hypothetical protein
MGYSGESGRAVALLVSVPSLPFSTPDGVQWNGYGGLYGQSGANYLPTAPRNSNSGRWNHRLDLRASRRIPVGGRALAEVLFEGFNVLNRRNYNGFNNTLYTAVASTVTTPVATPIVLRANENYMTPNNNSSQPDGTNARRFQIALRLRY